MIRIYVKFALGWISTAAGLGAIAVGFVTGESLPAITGLLGWVVGMHWLREVS